ncbi:hypothetical protein J1614_010437, partial [Plenodomus biglobosus]
MSTPSLRQVIGMPNSTASVSDSVLIIIDAQDECLYGQLPAIDYKEVNLAISSLLEKYRKLKGQVVHVMHNMGSDDAPIFKPTGKLTKEMDGIEAIDGEAVVHKTFAGSFSGTNLEEIVKKTGLNKLVLTGYMAHGCVSSTAREAATLGFEVLVVEDGVGQRNMKDIPAAEIKKVALAELDDISLAMISQIVSKLAKRCNFRLSHTLENSRTMPHPPRPGMDPIFCYTNGRWLWDEREQLESRYRRFDVSSLQQAACQAVGADRRISFKKIGEGNYNKAYRLEMEDGRRVIVKVPHPNAGPQVLTTASEVATMEFARTILNIPVPRVLAWNAIDQNPVQAEYIIMEEARGSQLHQVWQDLSLQSKSNIIREFADIERKLLSISFKQTVVLQDASRLLLRLVHKKSSNTSNQVIVLGLPLREISGKTSAVICNVMAPSVARREIDWISAHVKPRESKRNPWQYTNSEQSSPEAHIALLQKFIATIPHITPQDPELVSPRLWHPDFHAGNIYFNDQDQISCIIGWQGAWTTPSFIGANPPLLLDYGIDMLMKLPENFKAFDDATKEKLRYQVSQSILIHT